MKRVKQSDEAILQEKQNVHSAKDELAEAIKEHQLKAQELKDNMRRTAAN